MHDNMEISSIMIMGRWTPTLRRNHPGHTCFKWPSHHTCSMLCITCPKRLLLSIAMPKCRKRHDAMQ